MNRNEPCPCGSGKRFKHCHGNVAPPESASMPGASSAIHAAARAAYRTGSLAGAERIYREIVGAHPDDVEAIHMLGVVLLERFRLREALDHLWEAAERTRWAEPVVRRNLGLVLAKLLSPRANERQKAIVAAFVERERARSTDPPYLARVSVVLLGSADARTTERTMDSVAAQTYRNVELVVADCSAQAPAGSARGEWREHLTLAANAAARRASGAYLAFVEASDRLAPNCIEVMVAEVARAYPLWGFSQVGRIGIGPDAGPQNGMDLAGRGDLGDPESWQSGFPVDEVPSLSLLSRDVAGGSGNLFVPRDVFLRLGGYRPVACHGWDFRVRAAREIEPVLVDRLLYFRGNESGRVTSNQALGSGRDAPGAIAQRMDDLLTDALTGDLAATNELCPQHPANRILVLRAALRAGRGDRVPASILREATAEWRLCTPPSTAAVPVEGRAPSAGQHASKVALVVLGVYRSGTSALARVLNLCGAELPERLMAPRLEMNPRGFWEGEAIVDLDAQLLRRLGIDWNRVDFALPSDGPFLEEFLAGARTILESEFLNARMIVIKDPRVCLVAPLWHRALQASGYRPAYIVSVRHPVEAARSIVRSLRAYRGMPIEQGLAMWQGYMQRAETFVSSTSARTVHVGYRELLADWRRTVRRIARQLDVPLDVDTHAAEIDRYLEPGMRNERVEDGLEGDDLMGAQGDAIRSLYACLLERCDREVVAQSSG